MCAKTQKKQFEFINSYYSDLSLDEQVIALIVRSPVASGTIRSINHPSLPEGYSIFTKKDLRWETDIEVLDTKIPLLAYEKISYEGEAIAIVCGPSIHVARRIIAGLDIQFTEALEEAKNPEEDIVLHDIFTRSIDMSQNKKKIGSEIESLKDETIYTINKTYSTKIKHEFYKESIGCLAHFSKKNLSIFTPSLWAQNLVENVSAVTNIATEFISIKKTISHHLSESNIWAESYIACLASYASLLLEKPVFLQIDKNDERLFFYNSPEFSTSFNVSFTSEGKILSIDAHCQIDCGAFPIFKEEIINRTKVACIGAYSIPEQKIRVDILKSAKPPLSIDINAVDTHAQFAIEVLMQDIAMKLKLFPHELRLKNIETAQSGILDLGAEEIPSLIETSIDKSQFLRRYATYNLVSQDPELFLKHKPCRGIGMSIGFQGSSFASSILENKRKELSLTLRTDESVIIHAHTHSKKIANIWKQMAAQELSIPPEKIKLDPSYAVLSDAFPSTIHRNINITTSLIKRCAKGIEAKRFHEALPIVEKKAIYTQRPKTWNLKKLEGKPYFSYAWASAVIDLEIDSYSYEVLIKKVWVTIHAGKILNREDAEKSVKKNIQQQLSRYLPEESYVSFLIDLHFISSEDDPKEIGSLMNNIIPSALHSALTLALQKPIPQLPLVHDSVFKLIKGKENENTMHS